MAARAPCQRCFVVPTRMPATIELNEVCMDSAQDKFTGEIVEAEQLWLVDNVDKDRYICRGCGIKVTPASYRPENLVRPYFTARDGDHESKCDVAGEKKLVARGKKGRLSTATEGFPAPYPSRLVLRELRAVVDSNGSDAGDRLRAEDNGRRRTSDGGTSTPNRRRVANTIRPICRTFINFPYDRHLDLEVPGIDAFQRRDDLFGASH
jgi:hypothetical protein